jgi:itaconyl-CoA hydratase
MSEGISTPPASVGGYFEDLAAGRVIRHWPGRTVSEADDTWFSMMTMNGNPIHFDAAYAAHVGHGQRLVNGLFVLSLSVGMSTRDVAARALANLGMDKIHHVAPVFHGDTLYAISTILEGRISQSKPDRGIVRLETRTVNQSNVEVLRFERTVLVPIRPKNRG